MKKNKTIIILLLLSTLLVSACIEVDVHQKLKRNGNTDLIITYTAPTEVIDLLKESINTQNLDIAKYEETNNSIKFFFKNINQDINIGMFQEDEDLDEYLFKTENFELKKEFRFPYYYFTYKFNLGEEKEESTTNDIIKITYTIEVFGRIVETNGEQLSKQKVRFDMINPNKENKVVFRDFFLTTWIGSLF